MAADETICVIHFALKKTHCRSFNVLEALKGRTVEPPQPTATPSPPTPPPPPTTPPLPPLRRPPKHSRRNGANNAVRTGVIFFVPLLSRVPRAPRSPRTLRSTEKRKNITLAMQANALEVLNSASRLRTQAQEE